VIASPRLPTNRKERYYTATVLPALISKDNFNNLDLFLSLCGLHDCAMGDDFQFFTEYGFGESVFTEEDKAFWQGPFSRDTPDLVIRGGDWLLTVEAKMFDKPSAADLRKQLMAQEQHIGVWIERLKVGRHKHVLLLPKILADTVGVPLSALGSSWPVVTWEAVADLYRGIADPYWLKTLDDAIDKYPSLVSAGPQFGQNSENRLTGRQIFEGWPEHGYKWMGRRGGLKGPRLNADISENRWQEQVYEVNTHEPLGNPNWFSVAAFIDRIHADPPSEGMDYDI
jgi:hypothetical protein